MAIGDTAGTICNRPALRPAAPETIAAFDNATMCR